MSLRLLTKKEVFDHIRASAIEAVADIVHDMHANSLRPDSGEYDEKREDRIREQMEQYFHYAESGPTFDPEGKYLCGSCYYRQVMDWGTLDKCYIVDGTTKMDIGSCCYYRNGNPDSEWNPLPILKKYSQVESMYAERPKAKAFGCLRCEYADEAKKPDSKGRKSWCKFFGVHIRKDACCTMEDGPDMKTPEEINAGGPGSGRHPDEDSEKLKEKLPEQVTDLHTAAFKQALEENGGKWSSGVGARAQEILEQWVKEGKKLDAAIDNSQRGQFAGSLWNHIKVTGFSGPEEEGLRAMLSRVPPELFYNVTEFRSSKELGIKHGRFVPETKTIMYNPRNFIFRQRFGKGPGWVQHAEMTAVHEVGHSIYESLTPEQQKEWQNCSGWVVGYKEGNAPPYVEVRPGWPHMTSAWTHRAGAKFTRHYAEKNPNEDFADSLAFFILGKGFQMEPAKRKFLEDFVKDKVKGYPSVNIQSPVAAYPKQEAIRKSKSV